MQFEDLTPEQMEKVKSCKSPEDILALAREEGFELSDKELEGINGGWGDHCDDDECHSWWLHG